MLCKDAEQRVTLQAVANHRWMMRGYRRPPIPRESYVPEYPYAQIPSHRDLDADEEAIGRLVQRTANLGADVAVVPPSDEGHSGSGEDVVSEPSTESSGSVRQRASRAQAITPPASPCAARGEGGRRRRPRWLRSPASPFPRPSTTRTTSHDDRGTASSWAL